MTGVTDNASETASELFPYARYADRTEEMAARFREQKPFRFLEMPDFLDEDVARRLVDEFPAPDDKTWIQYKHYNENKLGKHKREELPPTAGQLVDELCSPQFVAWLSEVTGIEGLLADPDIDGGGLHQTKRGGFLNVHVDFTAHRYRPNWQRRCNLIVYLNEDWDPSWNGALEFWGQGMSSCVAAVPPMFNHAVVFETTNTSLHGYPQPLECPDGVARKSFHLYYYSEINPLPRFKATSYQARPGDKPLARFMIWLDSKLVAVYSGLKRRFGLSDRFASWALGFISRFKSKE